MLAYSLVISDESNYVYITNINKFHTIANKETLEKSFDGKNSKKLIPKVFQTPETHVFQAALRTPWLKEYEPFSSSMTDILIYSILHSAHENVIECILTSHTDKLDWKYLNEERNTIFHIALLQTKLSDQIIFQMMGINHNLLDQSIHHINSNNESLLSIAFQRQSYKSQEIIERLLEAGATIFVRKDDWYVFPKFAFHVAYHHNEIAIILNKKLQNGKIMSLLSTPLQVIYKTTPFKTLKSYDLGREEHKYLLQSILSFPCDNLVNALITEKILPVNEIFDRKSSLLHLAAEFGYSSVLREILSVTNLQLDQLEPNTQNNALHRAVIGNKCENLKVLLSHNQSNIDTSLNTKNNENATPLELAIRNRFFSGILAILESKLSEISEQWLQNVIIAIINKDSDLVKVLLSFFSYPISQNALACEKTDQNGFSILHIAVIHFDEEIFQIVIQKYKQNPQFIDREVERPLVTELSGDTPLILSLKEKQFVATEKLLEAGASNLLVGKLCYFQCLVEYCHDERTLEQLLKIKLNPNQFPIAEEMTHIWQVLDCEHNTLLHYSLKCNNHIAVKLLGQLTQFPSYSHLDNEGNSILHTAAKLNGSNELTSDFIMALRKHKSNPEYTELIDMQERTNGYSALMLSVEYANSNMFHFLIDEKASLLLYDNNHNSILHIIVEYGRVEFFKVIMNVIDSSKSPDFERIFHTPNGKGNSPIEKAVLMAQTDIIRLFRQTHDLKFTNSKTGLTLVHQAVIIGKIDFTTREELLKELLTERSLLETRDLHDQTPTFLAVSEKKFDSLKILLEYNPNICIFNEKGFTMLQMAVECYNKEIFQLLLSNITSRPNCREIFCFQGNNGKDVLYHAIECANYDATERLLTLQPTVHNNDAENNTYIHIACKFSKSSNILVLLIRHFLKQDNDRILRIQNLNSFTPLLYSIYNNNHNACEVLLSHKTDLFYLDEDSVQQFHAKIDSSKLTFCQYSKVYYVGYSFNESNSLYWILSTLTKLENTQILSNTTVQSMRQINDTLISQTIKQPSSQLLNVLLGQLQPFLSDFNRFSSLYIPAARNGSYPVVSYLINQHITPEDLLNTNKSSILYESIRNSDDKVFMRICETVGNLPDSSFKRVGEILDTNQTTHPLLYCLELNKLKIFEFLLMEKIQIPLAFCDQRGYTIIHEILRSANRKDFLKIFIDKAKERVLTLCIENVPLVDCAIHDSMQTPLHLCALHYTNCLNMVIQLKPCPTSRDSSGNTPLHLAVKAKDLVRIKCIVEAFKKTDEVLNALNYKHLSPLHLAAMDASEDIVKELIVYGADIYTPGADEKTVLHYSVLIPNQEKSLSIVRILLEQVNTSLHLPSEDLILQRDNQGLNALHSAVKCSNIKVTEYLLQLQPDLSAMDNNYNTVFHLAVQQKSSAIVNSVLRANGLMEDAKKSPSYEILNKKNSQGYTALSLAIIADNQNATQLILRVQPLLNICDEDGNSPLHLAVQCQSENILNELLSEMKSLNPEGIQDYLDAVNNTGLSPLHYAISMNGHTAARILCDAGSQLAIREPNGDISLCDGKSGLKLRLLVERKGSLFWTDKSSYLVCYTLKVENKNYFITCLLPELIITQFSDSDTFKEMRMSETAMQILTKCESIEPLVSAIDNKLIDMSNNDSLKQLQSVLGTASVKITEYLYTHYPDQMNTTESLKMLKSAVGTINNNAKIKDCIKRFPPLDNPQTHQSNKNLDIQEVENIIKESLRICLTNESTTNLKILLDNKARINYLYEDNNGYTTLLHIILQQGIGLAFFSCILEEIEKREPKSTFINERAMIDYQNQDGKTVLHLCIEKGNKPFMEKLFSYVPDINIKDKFANTIVHLAAGFCEPSTAQYIFDKIGTDEYSYFFQSINANGCSPLHLAASAGMQQTCRILLLEYGTPLYMIDNQQQSVLHHSLKAENSKMRNDTLFFLLSEHREGNDNFLRLQDEEGRTALHLAVFLQYEEEVSLLIKADPSVIEICDKSSSTPLHLAITPKLSISSERIFVKLFDILEPEFLNSDSHHLKETVICQQDVNGRTVLHLAIQQNNQFALEKILSTQPCLDIPDNEGNTILHEAVKYPCDPNSFKIIIDTIKANFPQGLQYYLGLKNSKGIPPLHYAIVHQHFEAAKLLTEENSSLYFTDHSGNISLCDGIGKLELTFLLDNKTNKATSDRAYYVGYLIKGDSQPRWIMSDLPRLCTTTFTDPQSDMIIKNQENDFLEEGYLNDILKCHSHEPLAAAFRRKFLKPSQKIKNKHLTQFIGENATPEVMRYYLTQFNGTVYQQMERCPCILESAVSNPNINTLCVVIQALPNDIAPLSTFDQQLSRCLQSSLSLSLSNKDTKALDELLKYKPSHTLTYTYGEDKGSLLHEVVIGGKSVEYAESILRTACEIQLTIRSRDDTEFTFVNFPDSKQRTVLHRSILINRDDMLDLLLNYLPDLSLCDFEGNTALHLAVNCPRKQSLVKTILGAIKSCQNPAEYLEARNKNELTPLLLSITKSNPQIVRELLDNNVYFYVRGRDNSTLLHRVLEIQTSNDRKAMMGTILKHEKETLNLENHLITSQQDSGGSTPLHATVKKGQLDDVETLITADPTVLSICDVKLQTALHLSISILSPNNEIFNYLLKSIQSQLLQSVCKFDEHILCFQDIDGKTPLHLAIESQNTIALQELLLSSACLSVVDNSQENLLHTAVRKSDTQCETVKTIIQKFKENDLEKCFHQLNNEGYPPLLLAIQHKLYQAAIELVSNSVGICFRDRNNNLSLTCKSSNLKLRIIYNSQSPNTFWIGYQIIFELKNNWIAAQLPDLEHTQYFKHDINMQICEIMDDHLLIAILKCHSSDPFTTAIQLGLFDPNLNDHKWVNSVGKYSTKEVIEAYIYRSKHKIYERLNDNLSLLESAVANQDISVLNFLLETLTQQSFIPPTEETVDNEMVTLCLKNSLVLSLQNTNTNALNKLFEYKTGIDHTYDNGNTLLHLIIDGKRDPQFIKSLMLFAQRNTNIPKFIDIPNEHKMTAFHLAIFLESKEICFVKTLLQYNPSLLISDKEGNTPLHSAIKESVDFLILEEIVTYCRKTPEIINARNDSSCTPLHFAVDGGGLNFTKLLLKSNADIYTRDKKGSTVLHHAVEMKKENKITPIIKRLKSFESKNFPTCKLNLIQDKDGQTPLHIAVTKLGIEVVVLLLDMSSVNSKRNSDKQTPLHLAVMRNDVDIFNAVFESLKLFEQWPNERIPYTDSIANSQNKKGKTPLLLSIEHNNTHAFKVLLAAQAILTTVDQSGDTVLHYAVRANCPEDFLTTLIQKVDRSMLTKQNNNDLPPLQYAIQQQNYLAVKELIDAGVKLDFKDKKNEVTLCHSKGGMSLTIYKYKQGSLKLWTGFEFKVVEISYFVLTDLPNLSKTLILNNVKVTPPKKLEGNKLNIVALCKCHEPLIAAFYFYDLNLKVKLPDGSDVTEIVAKCAPPKSIEWVLKKDHSTLIKGRDDHLSMVESAVSNPNVQSLEFLLSSINDFYCKQKGKTDNFKEEKLKCLKNSLKLSLSNDDPTALAILLVYQTPQTLFYEGNDTLLHLMVKKDKPTEFINKISCFLNVPLKCSNELTHPGMVNYIDLRNDHGHLTALQISIERGQEENVKTLLKYNPDVSLPDKQGNISIHFAAKQRKVTFVTNVINAKRKSSLNDFLNAINTKRETPLHISVIHGNKDVTEFLLRSNADYTLKSCDGYSILHHAVELQFEPTRSQLIELILEYEKAYSYKNLSLTVNQDDIGYTPLILAIQKKRLDTVKRLIAYDQSLRITENAGLSPLHYAVLSLNTEIFDTVLEAITEKENAISKDQYNENFATDLLDYRLICAQDNKNKTPLHLSIEKHNLHALEALLLCKPCLNIVDFEGNTLLHCAVKFQFVEGLRILLGEIESRFEDDFSHFVNLLNADNLPPLHYAIKESNVECIQLFLEHRISLAFTDAYGETTLADGLNGLSLSFIVYEQNGVKYWTGYDFIVANKISWVMSCLPSLEKSILIKVSTDVNKLSYLNEDILQAISQSKSFEPLNAAVRTKTLMLDELMGNTLPFKVISQHGTRQSLRCLLKYKGPNLFASLDGACSIIESAVHNIDKEAFDSLLETLPEFHEETIPVVDENENVSQNVKICMCFKNSFELSISNETPTALISLLKYFPKLNYRYVENDNTLMHLMINKEKSWEFIKCVFTFIKENNLQFLHPENVPIIDLKNSIGQTMIHICIQLKQWDNFEVLIDNFPNLLMEDAKNENSLHYAVKTNEINFVKKCLQTAKEKSLQLMSTRNVFDLTALHLAIEQGNNDITEFLLESKSPFYPQEENEATILHLAVGIVDTNSRLTLIKTILNHEPHPYSCPQRITCCKDGHGYSPLHLSVVNRYHDAVNYLLKIDSSPLLIRDKNQQTPLHLSLISHTNSAQKYPCFSPNDNSIFSNVLIACIDLHGTHQGIEVCDAKHLICLQDSWKRTAIHYAIKHMNTHALKELLATGSCLDIPDEHGYISTHEAVDNNNDITCLEMLVEELFDRYGDSLLEPFNFGSD